MKHNQQERTLFAFFMHNCHCEERNNEAISKKLASPRNDK
jgi:hypothetical protein